MSQQTVVVKQFGLSRKEQELKNKLFATSSTETDEMVISKRLGNAVVKGNHSTNSSEDFRMDTFLRKMENEFKSMNKNQVSLGSLSTQTQQIRQQNEALDANSKQLNSLMGQIQTDDQLKKQKQDLMEQNRKIMQELLHPINAQILEIKKAYEQTKETSNQAKQTGDVEAFQKQNLQLKSKLSNAQREVEGLLQPEANSQSAIAFSKMTNVNLEVYQKTIQNLKTQIEDLQKEAQRAEIELEERQLKLNNLPKQQEMLLPIQEHVQAYVDNIDFIQSQQLISFKLGGELDYQEFQNMVSEINVDAEQLWRDYQREMEKHTIEVPKVVLTTEELAKMSYAVPSLIDSLKVSMGLDPKVPMQDPHRKRKSFHSRKSSAAQTKKQQNNSINQKPKNLLDIHSQPKECAKEIDFAMEYQDGKQEIGVSYNTVLPQSEQRKNLERFNSFQIEFAERNEKAGTSVTNPSVPQPATKPNSPTKSSLSPTRKENVTFSDSVNSSPSNSPTRKPKRIRRKRSPKKASTKIEDELDEELKAYIKADYDDAYESYLKRKMDEKPPQENEIFVDQFDHYSTRNTQNKRPAIQPTGLMSEDSEDDEDDDDDEDEDDDENANPMQGLDKNTIKGIFLDILKENKDKLFGTGRQIPGQLLPTNTQSIAHHSEKQDHHKTELLSQPRQQISSKPSHSLHDTHPISQQQQAYSIPQQQQQQQQQHQQHQQQQQHQDGGFGFLNIINQTLAQVSQSVAAIQRPPSISSQLQSNAQRQSNNTNNMSMNLGGIQGLPPYYPNPMAQNQQQLMNYYSQQMPQLRMSSGIPGMSDVFDQYNRQVYGGQQVNQLQQKQDAAGGNRTKSGRDEDKKIDLSDFYQEFELSDSSLSVEEMKSISSLSRRSFAESIFENEHNNSRSIGQISVENNQKRSKNGDRQFAVPGKRKAP